MKSQLAHLLRFFAHLILFLRLISLNSSAPLNPLPTEACAAILDAYIRVLQAHSAPASVIAFYCASLEADHAIEAYSRYLFTEYLASPSMTAGDAKLPAERSERRRAVLYAKANGLDLPSVARRVVEMTLADIYTELPDFDAATAAFGLTVPQLREPGHRGSSMGVERETELVRSVEWLTFDTETYIDALGQANALMRYFLCESFGTMIMESLAYFDSRCRVPFSCSEDHLSNSTRPTSCICPNQSCSTRGSD